MRASGMVAVAFCVILSGTMAAQQPNPPEPPPNVIPQQMQSQDADEQQVRRVRISQGVAEAMIDKKVRPEYPPLARQARIQGSVVLAIRVGKDGRVEWLKAIEGHPMLIPAAIDAVKQWEYKPYYLNGEPVVVVSTVTVNFMLGSAPEAAGSAQAPSSTETNSSRVRLPEDIAELLVTEQVTPEYPPMARRARITDDVTVRLVVNADGKLQQAQVVHGDPMLMNPVIAAVRQWQFRPPSSIPFILQSAKSQGSQRAGDDAVEAEFLATIHFDGSTTKILSPIPMTPATEQIPGVKAGLLVHRVIAKYPEDVDPATGPARVMVEIDVNSNGVVTAVRPQDGDPRFFAASIAAVQQWRYVPGFVRGEPIATVHHAIVRFTPPQRIQTDIP